jgi:hypothetical protein
MSSVFYSENLSWAELACSTILSANDRSKLMYGQCAGCCLYLCITNHQFAHFGEDCFLVTNSRKEIFKAFETLFTIASVMFFSRLII